MAKFSKAIVVSRPRTLAKTVPVEVVRPTKQLAVRPDGQLAVRPDGQLATVKKGSRDITVVNTGGDAQVARRREGERGSPNGDREETSSGLKGIVTLKAAAEAAANFIAPEGLPGFHAALEAVKLSMGNKRKREKLADGGSIQRRLAGTGYGGANNKGFLKGRGSKGGVQKNTESQTSEEFRESVRKRWEKKPAKNDVTAPKGTLQLGDRSVRPALPGRAKPLALPSGASGFASQPLALGEGEDKQLAIRGEKQLATVPGGKGKQLAIPSQPAQPAKLSKVAEEMAPGTVENVKGYVEAQFGKVNRFQQMTDVEQKAAFKLKTADIKAAWKAGKYALAIDLATSGVQRWASPAQQQAAESFIEKQLQ